jgi:RNA polymerase sigma-70 factor (ECF subfamily)
MDERAEHQDLLRRALEGDEAALRSLVVALTPVIHGRIARVLLRTGYHAAGRNVRQELEDIAQEVFLALFANNARILASWEPERGLSLRGFAALVAERQTVTILRSGKRSPFKEDPTLNEELDREDPETSPEGVTASRQALRRLLEALHEELSPLGRHLFDLLFLKELPVGEVVRQTAMSNDAVYAWRSRLRRLAHKLHSRMEG